jgi:hypothetical protein
MKILRTFIAVVCGTALLASTAHAQSETSPGAAVSFGGGVASTSSITGAVLGGSVLFDVNEWVALEGEGSYLDRGAGADALSASGSLLINMLPSRGRVVPYAAVGGGVYRASFDMGDPRMLGTVGSQFQSGAVVCPAPGTGMGFGPGAGFGMGTGECPATAAGYMGVGRMPAFYGNRLGPLVVPDTGIWETRSFVDPAATIGGGVRFHVSDRIMIRPDLRARLIFGDGDTHVMAVFAFNVGYRF